MPLSRDDLRRLRGLMARTASDNDSEALASIRAANRLLTAAGYTWDLVFDRTITVLDEVENGDDGLEATFEAAMKNARGSFLAVVESIYEQWEKNGTISDRQRAVVERAAKDER